MENSIFVPCLRRQWTDDVMLAVKHLLCRSPISHNELLCSSPRGTAQPPQLPPSSLWNSVKGSSTCLNQCEQNNNRPLYKSYDFSHVNLWAKNKLALEIMTRVLLFQENLCDFLEKWVPSKSESNIAFSQRNLFLRLPPLQNNNFPKCVIWGTG